MLSTSSKLANISLQELNNSDLDSLTNTSCSNFTTIDLSNASSTVINSFTYGVGDPRNNLNLIHPFWISMFCVSLFGLITNSSFVVTVVKTPLHSATYIFFTCLACTDCIILITQLHAIVQILFHYTTTKTSTEVFSSLSILCFLLSNWFRYSCFCRTILVYLSPFETLQDKRS